MTISQDAEQTPRRPLWLWPGVVIVILQWLVRFALPIVAPETGMFAVVGGVFGGALAILVWWVLLSRAPWSERLGAIAVMIVAVFATSFIVHPSIRGGMMGMMLVVYSIPVLSLALVVWAVGSRRLAARPRRVAMVAAIVLACGVWTLVRTNGVLGGGADFAWRWTKTPEEKLLARADDEPAALPSAPTAVKAPEESLPAPAGDKPAAVTSAPAPAETPEDRGTAKAGKEPAVLPSVPAPAKTAPADPSASTKGADWPGFRGPDRNDVVRGVRIMTDWSASPPVELWRRPIGPGWSSFAVRGDLLYTQEQRGDDEIVACYKVSTGEPVWRHRDGVRFWESNGGAGPRATPTLSGGRVYTFGATGIVNALDARNGSLVWSRNAGSDTGVKVPDWGFASSPLVVGDVVIVAASGALVAYDRSTGTPRWSNKSRGGSYSSPHLLTIDGVTQVLTLNGSGATSVAPADGKVLWEDAWQGVPIVQPAQIAAGDIVITAADMGGGMGVRRISVAQRPGGWNVDERWTSNGLKPYFNDFVVHKGHAFGFDGSILACIDLADGKRKWKGGRYGNGQLVLLADQDVLLVLSEDGELALVSATTEKFVELARFPALEGKTWNHPVLVGEVLLVRNGEEMAAFRLSLAAQ
jgi:outer membrane protein assembly factor BamB